MRPEIKDFLTLIIAALTPIITGIVGWIFIKRTEKIKLAINKNYDFKKKWADDFYEACKEYMSCIERDAALIGQLTKMQNPNEQLGTSYQNEMNNLHVKIPEIQIRIRRMGAFFPNNTKGIEDAMTNIQEYLAKVIKSGGNFDDLFKLLTIFNNYANNAHKEILQSK